jgi:hypothetical protein
MVEQLGQDLQVSSSGPITIEVAYSLSTAQSLYPIAPVLTLASPLMAGVDEQDMRDELALALTQYMSVQASGWRLRWEASSRAALLRSIIAWEATQVTGSGLDDERAGLLAGAVAANELLSLAQVWPDPALPAVGSSDLRYAQGWAAIDYIATRYGRQSVAALLARLEGAASADEALRLALGLADLNEFEPGWVQFMRDKYGRKD